MAESRGKGLKPPKGCVQVKILGVVCIFGHIIFKFETNTWETTVPWMGLQQNCEAEDCEEGCFSEHVRADPIAGMDWVIEELLQQSDEADFVPVQESPFHQAPG